MSENKKEDISEKVELLKKFNKEFFDEFHSEQFALRIFDFFYSEIEALKGQLEKHKRATSEYFKRWEQDQETIGLLKIDLTNTKILLEACESALTKRDENIEGLRSEIEKRDKQLKVSR